MQHPEARHEIDDLGPLEQTPTPSTWYGPLAQRAPRRRPASSSWIGRAEPPCAAPVGRRRAPARTAGRRTSRPRARPRRAGSGRRRPRRDGRRRGSWSEDPHRLVAGRRQVGHHAVRGIEHGRRVPPAGRQAEPAAGRCLEVDGEATEVGGARTPEPVDGLMGVADGHHARSPGTDAPAAGSARRWCPVLVEQHHAEALSELGHDVGGRLADLEGESDLVRVLDEPRVASSRRRRPPPGPAAAGAPTPRPRRRSPIGSRCPWWRADRRDRGTDPRERPRGPPP